MRVLVTNFTVSIAELLFLSFKLMFMQAKHSRSLKCVKTKGKRHFNLVKSLSVKTAMSICGLILC